MEQEHSDNHPTLTEAINQRNADLFTGLDTDIKLVNATEAKAFQYEGYQYNYAPEDGRTIKDPTGKIIYSIKKFDLGKYVEHITNRTDIVFGFKMGLKKNDPKSKRLLKRGVNITKRATIGIHGMVTYEILKNIIKPSANIIVNTIRLRERTLKHMEDHLDPIALIGLYKGYFKTELDKINQNEYIEYKQGKRKYTIHKGKVSYQEQTEGEREGERETTASAEINTEDGQSLIRGDKDQKIEIGIGLILAIQKNNQIKNRLQNTKTEAIKKEIMKLLKIAKPT